MMVIVYGLLVAITFFCIGWSACEDYWKVHSMKHTIQWLEGQLKDKGA